MSQANQDWRTDFEPRHCEHFDRTYINRTGWNGHLHSCPIYGGAEYGE